MLTVDGIIRNALHEDLGWGDVTTDSTIPKGTKIKGHFIAKEQGVICGIEVCKRVYEIMDDSIVFEILIGTLQPKQNIKQASPMFATETGNLLLLQ